jgi:hypothetical protein
LTSINIIIPDESAFQCQEPADPAEEVKSIPKTSEGSKGIEELRVKLRDLEIASRVKDHFIEQKDREAFDEERQRYVSQLMAHSRKVGELETQLLQLGAPVSKKGLPEG